MYREGTCGEGSEGSEGGEGPGGEDAAEGRPSTSISILRY